MVARARAVVGAYGRTGGRAPSPTWRPDTSASAPAGSVGSTGRGGTGCSGGSPVGPSGGSAGAGSSVTGLPVAEAHRRDRRGGSRPTSRAARVVPDDRGGSGTATETGAGIGSGRRRPAGRRGPRRVGGPGRRGTQHEQDAGAPEDHEGSGTSSRSTGAAGGHEVRLPTEECCTTTESGRKPICPDRGFGSRVGSRVRFEHPDGLVAIGDVELLQRGGDVAAHRDRGDVEALGDEAGREPLAQQVEDLRLPGRELDEAPVGHVHPPTLRATGTAPGSASRRRVRVPARRGAPPAARRASGRATSP